MKFCINSTVKIVSWAFCIFFKITAIYAVRNITSIKHWNFTKLRLYKIVTLTKSRINLARDKFIVISLIEKNWVVWQNVECKGWPQIQSVSKITLNLQATFLSIQRNECKDIAFKSSNFVWNCKGQIIFNIEHTV